MHPVVVFCLFLFFSAYLNYVFSFMRRNKRSEDKGSEGVGGGCRGWGGGVGGGHAAETDRPCVFQTAVGIISSPTITVSVSFVPP